MQALWPHVPKASHTPNGAFSAFFLGFFFGGWWVGVGEGGGKSSKFEKKMSFSNDLAIHVFEGEGVLCLSSCVYGEGSSYFLKAQFVRGDGRKYECELR